MAMNSRRRTVTALAPYERGWSNVELAKDCGLMPYILYKDFGYDVKMVGANSGPYPYLDMYVKGLDMVFLPDGNVETKCDYIARNAEDIDLLILRGCYPTNFLPALTYKKYNPRGKIYVGLDANSAWMDRIIWTDEYFVRFMDSCDIIATSCRTMARHLNEKWPWNIDFIPNGYYDLTGEDTPTDISKKKNIILTVGRIGTEQKRNETMLIAFALIEKYIPSWKMKLVGSIEKSFEAFIDDYYKQFPHLRDRVIFTGPISDKKELRAAYDEAKIFTLSSVFEGAPNVISEALHSGCATLVTEFDAYSDAINDGLCGFSAPIDDTETFAQRLHELCSDEKRLRAFSQNALLHCERDFNMKRVVSRLDYLVFGGER